MTIRSEHSGDTMAVRRVNEAAFGRPDEAEVVARLRARAARYHALVALVEGEVVGHIAFSAMSMTPPASAGTAFGLAPMAVLPGWQRQGIGTALVRQGLASCAERGADAVFVLGHPGYYPRFGFEPASKYGIESEYDVPSEAFMVLELTVGVLGGVVGTARYDPALAG